MSRSAHEVKTRCIHTAMAALLVAGPPVGIARAEQEIDQLWARTVDPNLKPRTLIDRVEGLFQNGVFGMPIRSENGDWVIRQLDRGGAELGTLVFRLDERVYLRDVEAVVTTYDTDGATTWSGNVQLRADETGNRFEFSAQSSCGGRAESTDDTLVGALIGTSGDAQFAIASLNHGANNVGHSSASAYVLEHFDRELSISELGSAGRESTDCPKCEGERSAAACLAIIVVVVAFVAVTCLILGWWGCVWDRMITPGRNRLIPLGLQPVAEGLWA
jgi:hypothetical protein